MSHILFIVWCFFVSFLNKINRKEWTQKYDREINWHLSLIKLAASHAFSYLIRGTAHCRKTILVNLKGLKKKSCRLWWCNKSPHTEIHWICKWSRQSPFSVSLIRWMFGQWLMSCGKNFRWMLLSDRCAENIFIVGHLCMINKQLAIFLLRLYARRTDVSISQSHLLICARICRIVS